MDIDFAISNPFAIKLLLNTLSSISNFIQFANCSSLVGSKSRAASFNCSLAPSISEAITGHPREKASIGGKLSGPRKVGNTKAKAFLYKAVNVSLGIKPLNSINSSSLSSDTLCFIYFSFPLSDPVKIHFICILYFSYSIRNAFSMQI